MKEHRWRLFIDESGGFKSISDRSCVAGFLSRAPSTMAEARVRMSLERAFPELPWPLHASLLNHEVAWLFWLESSPENSTLKTLARQILSAAPAAAQPLLEDARARLKDGEEPDYDGLTQLRRYLQGIRHYPVFRECVQARRNAAFSLIQMTLRHDPENSHFTFVATLGEPVGNTITKDPYLSALVVLLERAANLLARTKNSHCVSIYAATRNVEDSTLGKTIRLNRAHIEQAVATAVFPTEKVRFTLDEVLPYSKATTGMMMADLLANRVWNMRSAGLAQVHQAIEMLGPEPTLLGLSGCATTGVARDEILRGPQAELASLSTVRPHWAQEQAAQWIEISRVEGQ